VCRLARTCSTQNITSVPSGVVITNEEEVYTVKSYAKVYVVLQLPGDPTQSWVSAAENLQAKLASVGYESNNWKTAYQPFSDFMRDAANRTTQRLRDYPFAPLVEKNPSRVKRGLFNFIGDAMSTLFGTPSASDVEALRKANEKIADAVDGVVKNQQKIVARVNKIGRAQGQVIGALRRLEKVEWQDRNLLMRSIWISAQLSDFKMQVDELLSVLDQMRLVRAACESNSHSEITVPPKLLSEILELAYMGTTAQVLGYYQYLSTDKIILANGTLYCVVNVPIAERYPHKKYTINTFPVCHNRSCYQIYQDQEFVFDPSTEDLYFPQQCYGFSPQVCRAGVVYAANTQPCLHGVINADESQRRQCPVVVTTDMRPPLPVATKVINRYVLQTPDITYHYRCPQKIPVSRKLKSGVYVVSIDSLCEMTSPQWSLKGKEQTAIYAAQPPPLPVPVALDFLDIKNLTPPSFPAGQSSYEYETLSDLLSPANPRLGDSVREIQNKIGSSHTIWVWLGLGIVLAVMIVYFAVQVYLRKVRKGPPYPPVELVTPKPPPESNTSAHYDPTTETVKLYPDLKLDGDGQ
jgi:hypothetical protein